MESLITGFVLFGLFTSLVAYVWRDAQKRIEAAMPRELCSERHKALDESVKEIKADLKSILKTLARMNGENLEA